MKRIRLIYFSPTGTTKKILETIAEGINIERIEHLDLSRDINGLYASNDFTDTLAIIGVPVYSGRIPIDSEQHLRKLQVHKVPAIIVVLYGNRAYDDALLELRNLSIDLGFEPFAAAAFIGEHSFSSEQFPIAKGRPDIDDLQEAKEFGARIRELIRNKHDLNKRVQVPGNYPYKERIPGSDLVPQTIDSKCTKCGVCVSVCPTSAIRLDNIINTDNDRCILCQACVKNCPTNARINDTELFFQIGEKLSGLCSTRKEAEFFTQ